MTLVTWSISMSCLHFLTPPFPFHSWKLLESSAFGQNYSVSKFTNTLRAKFKGLFSVCIFDLKSEFDTINRPLLPVLPLALVVWVLKFLFLSLWCIILCLLCWLLFFPPPISCWNSRRLSPQLFSLNIHFLGKCLLTWSHRPHGIYLAKSESLALILSC